MTLLLGIDIGTTATKAVLLDSERGLVAEAERPVTLNSDNLQATLSNRPRTRA